MSFSGYRRKNTQIDTTVTEALKAAIVSLDGGEWLEFAKSSVKRR